MIGHPKMPPAAYQTYRIVRPMGWWVFATCPQVRCLAHLQGWHMIVDEDRARVARAAGRAFTETRQPGGLIRFDFAAGQACWHCPPPDLVGVSIVSVLPRLTGRELAAADLWHKRVEDDREPLYGLVGGDRRGNPRGTRPVRFGGARQFIDDFGEHQLRLRQRQDRG